MQLASDPAPFVILRSDEIARKGAKLAIERFQLVRLAVKICEYAELRSLELRIHRNGKIIHRPSLIPFEPVQIGEVYP